MKRGAQPGAHSASRTGPKSGVTAATDPFKAMVKDCFFCSSAVPDSAAEVRIMITAQVNSVSVCFGQLPLKPGKFHVDSLGERLNNPLPRLSRLKRFYGERETGPRLRNARHVDLESAPARSATRSCDRGPDSANAEGHSA